MITEQQLRDILASQFFSGTMPPEFVDFCLAHGRIRHFAPKQYLYFAGDEATTVYFLIAGRVRLYLMGEFTEKIIRVINPPIFFPEVVLDDKPYPHAALCIEEIDVLAIDKQIFKRYLESNPSLLWLFIKELALDLRRSYRQIRNLSLGDARLRLGAKLFALAHVHGQSSKHGVTITIPLSATELAGMCSLARESVSRILSELKEVKLIEIQKKTITVLDMENLRTWIHERAARSQSLD
ncbi:cAMP-binding protein [Desulfosporosinus orientis DSM 765]|uniref:cAMP-binding protein n=1 Tax=Desulfosporosinus orientis (strain ATCC 19365 / DSM 765 / NCIMB 8382 / VKM B-1628 / Singapore I) TaxID=768706 RepID=G7W986_DESOD|nr:Crp/Fnr family transcriptional regulator [Desulfosporosinus orientis]AET68727.1 cAMP-binding protein [Desulfosporosinus orientis DSM 765]